MLPFKVHWQHNFDPELGQKFSANAKKKRKRKKKGNAFLIKQNKIEKKSKICLRNFALKKL